MTDQWSANGNERQSSANQYKNAARLKTNDRQTPNKTTKHRRGKPKRTQARSEKPLAVPCPQAKQENFKEMNSDMRQHARIAFLAYKCKKANFV